VLLLAILCSAASGRSERRHKTYINSNLTHDVINSIALIAVQLLHIFNTLKMVQFMLEYPGEQFISLERYPRTVNPMRRNHYPLWTFYYSRRPINLKRQATLGIAPAPTSHQYNRIHQNLRCSSDELMHQYPQTDPNLVRCKSNSIGAVHGSSHMFTKFFHRDIQLTD
jgi:hypothetical protein